MFEKCLKTVKSLFSMENVINFEILRKFKVSLTSTSGTIWTHKLPKEAQRCELPISTRFKFLFCCIERSFSAYVWSKVDSCFCEALYMFCVLFHQKCFRSIQSNFCSRVKSLHFLFDFKHFPKVSVARGHKGENCCCVLAFLHLIVAKNHLIDVTAKIGSTGKALCKPMRDRP